VIFMPFIYLCLPETHTHAPPFIACNPQPICSPSTKMAATKAAVIGATGILGKHIAHGLIDSGKYAVTIITRKVGLH
jgi:hypothetical protein